MRYARIIGVVITLLALAACSNPNPNCYGKGGQCWELSISGSGVDIAVGQEKPLTLYATMYSNGEVMYRGLRVSPSEVNFRVGNPTVLGLEIRDNPAGAETAYIRGLANGRSTLSAQLIDNPAARQEIVMDVVTR